MAEQTAMNEKTRRIVLLCTMTSPSGAPIAALRLAAGFAERGHEVRADFPYECLIDGPPRRIGDMLRIIARLWAVLRSFRPDAIFTFLPFAAVLGCFIARLCGVRARIVSHRVPRDTYSPALGWLDTLSGWLGNYTDVVAVSGSVGRGCASYPEWLRRRVRVVYNGLKGWQPSPLDKRRARTHLGLPETGFLVVAVGRIDRQKNYPVLIDALAGADERIHLAVAGDGADRAAIEARIGAHGLQNRVRLLGNIPRADVPHLLAAADVFAQPSLFEGQSNALLEALHAGLPCFVSEAPEQVETVRSRDGQIAGAVLSTQDAAAWREALNETVRSPERLAALRPIIAAQADLFTFERMMAGFVAVLDERLT
jgi:glycosyltransferase involved in cell wall biosynthesis